jgi:elongator complex protein 2
MVKIHPEYVSGGCNHSAHALDADYAQDVIVYASHRNVFEMQISSREGVVGDGCAAATRRKRYRTTILGDGGSSVKEHDSPVTCVKIVEKMHSSPSNQSKHAIVVLSADASGTVIAWEANSEEEEEHEHEHEHKHGKRKWTPRARSKHAFGPITQIAAKREARDSMLVATVAADDCVRLWDLNLTKRTMEQVGEKTFPSQHRPMCVDISDCVSSTSSVSSPSSSGRFVAVGCADGTTRLYAIDTKAPTNFEFVTELVGHDDWVRDAKFQSLMKTKTTTKTDTHDTLTLFLATCSQDKNARVWKIVTRNDEGGESEKTNTRLPFETLAAPPRPPSEVLGGARVDVQLEALLCGHEDWVFTCAWRPPFASSTSSISSSALHHQLLTASADRSVNLWSPSKNGEADNSGTSLWFSLASLGEAGENCLGYRGASFYGRNCFIAHSQSGALHAWEFIEELQSWESLPVNSGHTDKIRALVWDNDGRYFLTGSEDHTTRLVGYWNENECHDASRIRTPKGWREIARPQTHGHAISCLAVVPPSNIGQFGAEHSSKDSHSSKSSQSFISGSSEKALRAFRAPRVFWERMKIGNMNVDNVDALIVSGEGTAEASALGLSNKGIHGVNNENIDANVELLEEELSRASLDVKHGGAIVEEYLATNTLWPETSKLYGHGDDVFSVTAHPSGKLLASGAKGTKESTAEILLWEHNETHNDWRMVESLLGPTLTAVALEFSNDGETLIVASRDRHACVFTRSPNDAADLSEGWVLTNRFKAHAREMYDLAFLSDILFVTVGRDKKVNAWQVNKSLVEGETKPIWSSGSVCTSAPTCVSVLNDSTFATGHENGSILIWTRKDDDNDGAAQWSVTGEISHAHCAEVTKIAFKPSSSSSSSSSSTEGTVLASCGADCVTRIFRLTEIL